MKNLTVVLKSLQIRDLPNQVMSRKIKVKLEDLNTKGNCVLNKILQINFIEAES